MHEDILHPEFCEAKDAENIAHNLHRQGLTNVGMLIKDLYKRIADMEIEHEEKIQELEDAQTYDFENLKDSIKELASWFNNEFEDEKIQIRTIRGKTFAIMLESDLELLKKEFHKRLD